MESVEPYIINIPESLLIDLKQRLKNTRWTDEPEKSGWSNGINPKYLREVVDYWLNYYDWRIHEAALNNFNHFRTTIDGIGIHFIHEKGKGPNPVPIILTHGWPDSFYRFYKIIPLLTDPARFGGDPSNSFDVIIPSIPGFAFSDPVSLPSNKTAVLFKKLMTDVLGYKTFAAAGGDIGAAITKSLATQFPQSVTGIHLTDVGFPTGNEDLMDVTVAEQEYFNQCHTWLFTEGGYIMEQSTKPQTLGYALNDSPVGLAAWIIEKFWAWSDTKENIELSYTKDELITNIMIYWVTNSINTSIRTYLENRRVAYNPLGLKPIQRVEVPTAVAVFPQDDFDIPYEWAERMVNVKRFTRMPHGGHFATLVVPKLYVKDLKEFFYKHEYQIHN